MITSRSAYLFILALSVYAPVTNAQKKADRKMISELQTDISYLASDSLEGRRTSTAGERKAGNYIEKRYKEENIKPYKKQYRYPFHFVYGKEISGATLIKVNGTAMRMNDDAFPLPFSAVKRAASDVIPEIMEQGGIWILPLYTDADQAANPHFEAEKYMFEKTKEAEKGGASGVLFYSGYDTKFEPSFNAHSEYDPLGIPAAYLTCKAYQRSVKQGDAGGSGKREGAIQVDMSIAINKSERTGTNLAAYIDNGAKYTVIVGAHYDHLGYGEDNNSLFANAVKEHQVHHGADDNASGTAAVLQAAKWVKKKKLHHFNYLFLNFSGEELGLYGSKAFVKDQGIDSMHIAYMINMDMVGRLNDSTHALTLGGVGTSPAWADVVDMAGDNFKLVIDSSGIGPSDHTSFYNAGIPVLFFFTGTHKDYHKPSDKPQLINYAGETQVLKYMYKVLAKMDKEDEKPAYTVTKQATLGRVGFKVTLGIMPDYAFQDGGVRVDGISDNRPASKAGMKQGDIIIRLGDYKVSGMQTYMEALSKFAPGDKTKVTFIRDSKEMSLPIELSK